MTYKVITTTPSNTWGRMTLFSPETETAVEFYLGAKGYYEAEVSERSLVDEFRTKPKNYAVLEKGMAFPFEPRHFDHADILRVIGHADVKTIPFLQVYRGHPRVAKEVETALTSLGYKQEQEKSVSETLGLKQGRAAKKAAAAQAMEDKVEGKTPPAPAAKKAAKKAAKPRKKAAKKAAKKGSGKK